MTIPQQHLKATPPLDFNGGSPGPQPKMYEVVGRGPLYVQLCWNSSAPVNLSGAYLTARFPGLYSSASNRVAVTRELNLATGNTLDYAVQSLTSPSTVGYRTWEWSKIPFGNALSFAAVNTSVTQHDSYQAFLSGIVFGVAGGALVALIQELVAPFRSRKELRPPEPGG